VQGKSLVELDEILGYHLEQAARCLAELGRPDTALAQDASERLAAAGERTYWRGDLQAAHSLLGRALALVEQPDTHVEITFAMSHLAARDAQPLLESAAVRADARADAAGAALARGLAAHMRLWTGEATADEAEQLLRAALPLLQERDDHAGLARAWISLADGPYSFGLRLEESMHAADMARSFELLAGRPHQRTNARYAFALVNGPRPVAEALERVDALDGSWSIDVERAILLAMCDRIEEARDLVLMADEHAGELGNTASHEIAEVESIAGNHGDAADRLGRMYDWVRDRDLGDLGFYSAWQVRELALAGRSEEAVDVSAVRPVDHRDDAHGQALRRRASALVASIRGEHDEAERLAREAVAIMGETDAPKLQADAFSDLAEVLTAAGRRQEAIEVWHEALELYERKGVIPLAREVRERLAALESV
jgi:tetratricopeptide (TPR) repeat protein